MEKLGWRSNKIQPDSISFVLESDCVIFHETNGGKREKIDIVVWRGCPNHRCIATIYGSLWLTKWRKKLATSFCRNVSLLSRRIGTSPIPTGYVWVSYRKFLISCISDISWYRKRGRFIEIELDLFFFIMFRNIHCNYM